MTLYDDLGVDPGEGPLGIKKAHRDGMKKHHPDTGDGDLEALERVAHAAMILLDPEKRDHYDKTGDDGRASAGAEPKGEAAVILEVFKLFTGIIEEETYDPATMDIRAVISDHVTVTIANVRAEIAKFGGILAKIDQLEKRLIRKAQKNGGGPNPIMAEVFRSLRLDPTIILGRLDEVLTLQLAVKAVIDDHTYDFTAPPPRPTGAFYDGGPAFSVGISPRRY